jgi:hypothetical protein
VSEKPHTCDAYQTFQWVTLRYERGGRYYRLHLEQDLWGTWCLTRVNGRRKEGRGRSLTTWPGSLGVGLRALLAAAQSRRQAGYRLVP